ncbi:MAG: PspC domain-containing protein [Eubacterium sp.]|jgi:phage shock protein PspC (stress-responsive transcriptional regulator)|nr:PspC domain-containing protein [Eubacterium sp.]
MDKKLYKSRENRVICGVCGGIGEYFNIDPTVIRLLCLLLICGWGSGLLFYIVAAVIMPDRPY